MNKYALTELSILDSDRGVTLYRIVALRDIETILGIVKKGDLGGYVASEHNLSQDDECWVFANGKAFGQAIVTEEAVINDFGIIQDDAELSGNVILKNYGIVRENAIVTGECEIRGHAVVEGNVYLGGKYVIADNACIAGDVRINGIGRIVNSSYIYGHSILDGNIHVSKEAVIGGYAQLKGNVKITDSAIVNEHSLISDCEISGKCKILGYSNVDYDVGGNTVINMSLRDKKEVISKLKLFDPLLQQEKIKQSNQLQIDEIKKNLEKANEKKES